MIQWIGSQEIEEHQKRNTTQKWAKTVQNSSHGESDKCENNFIELHHQDNTLKKSLQSFQINY